MNESTWWWKAAVTVLLGMLGTVMLKGCEEWKNTNTALTQLSSDVKYQIDRVGQREVRLQQLEKSLTALNDRTMQELEKRRDLAQRLVDQIDDRLDRLEKTTR